MSGLQHSRRCPRGSLVMPALAEMPAEGTFVAAKACPALQSIRKETNPGGGDDRAPSTSYQPCVAQQPASRPSSLPGRCSGRGSRRSGGSAARNAARSVPAAAAEGGARSLQPVKPEAADAFPMCWRSAGSPPSAREVPQAPSAAAQTEHRFDAYELHARTACGRSPAPTSTAASAGRERALPPSEGRLGGPAAAPRCRLATQARPRGPSMPGSRSPILDRHEWVEARQLLSRRVIPKPIYRDSLRLLAAINGSPVAGIVHRGSIGTDGDRG